jgi:hypothetical protein
VVFRRLRAPACRRAFTLLEVLLAAGIGVLLLAALYVAVDIQLRHTQSGRDVIERSTLARALVHRMANDVAPTLAPPSPTRYQTSSSQGSGSGGSQGGQSGTGGTGGTGSGTPAASGAASASSSGGGTGSSSGSTSTSTSTTGSNYTFTLQGDSGRLTVYLSRIPREVLTPAAMQASDSPPLTSDLRRITYWLGGDGSLGLARQELQLVTSDDAGTVPPDGIGSEADYVIAPEVRSLAFSYYDGSEWQDSWDGTTPGSDGVTPMGPPLAIAVVLGIVPPGAAGQAAVKTYRHVIPISTANGTTVQSSSSSSSSGTQSTGSSTGTQNTGS